jgi:hypothetical protein
METELLSQYRDTILIKAYPDHTQC